MSRGTLFVGAAALATLVTGCGRETVTVESAASPADSFAESADPALATDPSTGDLLAAFVARGADSTWRLYFSRSSDAGATWSRPRPVTEAAGEVKPHGEASPRIVTASGGGVALVWSQDFKVEGRKWPASRIRFSRSLDSGASWSPAITLNDDTTAVDLPRGHTFHGAAGDGAGGVTVAWLDERKGGVVAHEHEGAHQHDASAENDATIYTVRSADFGTTWSANRPLWSAVCPCCRVTLAPDPRGGTAGAWRRHFPGDVRDVVTAELPASPGTPASTPDRVHDDGWVFPGCPHTGPALSIGEDGTRHIAWYTGRPGGAGVFLARSDRSGGVDRAPVPLVADSTLPAAHAAVLAVDRGASLAAWDIATGGTKRVSVALVERGQQSAAPVAVPGSDGAAHPQLAIAGPGAVFLAFTRVGPGGQKIGVARLRFGG